MSKGDSRPGCRPPLRWGCSGGSHPFPAIRHLERGPGEIFGAGTGNPSPRTRGAVLRAAGDPTPDVILLAKNVTASTRPTR